MGENTASMASRSGKGPTMRRRAMSAPAADAIEGFTQIQVYSDGRLTIVPPDTPHVRRKVNEGGPSLTLLDVAYDILERFQQVPENNVCELLFVRDCLKAGRAKTAVPCGLLPVCSGGDEVNDCLLRTYTQSSSPSTGSTATPRLQPEICHADVYHDEFESSEDELIPQCPLAHLSNSEMSELKALLGGADFDAWSLDIFEVSRLSGRRPLLLVGWQALLRNNCFSEFDIRPEKAQRFLDRVESMYLDEQATPYHNNLHAADVTQLVHSLLVNIGFNQFFDRVGCMAMILAAMTHDIGHRGRNSTFHINKQDDLALTYNDQSVLENFHVAEAFKLLTREPDVNLLAELSKDTLTRIRKEMIEIVLGTDMALHFDRVSLFKGLIKRLDNDPADWHAEPESLMAMQAMVVHAADTSTPAKPPVLADRWTDLLKEEFFLQGDEERALSMPLSPMCDRVSVKFASSQVGFIQFIVQPTFVLLSSVEPTVEAEILTFVAENAKLWEQRKLQEEEEKSEARTHPSREVEMGVGSLT